MKSLRSRIDFRSYTILFSLCIFIIFLSACGSGSGKSDSDHETSTGLISFNLKWGQPSPTSAIRARSPSGNVCEDYDIETISANVYNKSNTNVASEEWPCSASEGTIFDVPTGTNMRIIIEGSVSGGKVHWRGEKTGISVSAGQNTNAGIVTMTYIDTDITPPDVTSTSPSDEAINVPINTTITATFSEDVVAASVNTSIFTLSDSSSNIVPGSVTYDSETHTATFDPNSALSYSTLYIATITSNVQDKAGIPIENYTWGFTTEEPPDTTPPTVISTNPADDTDDVPINSIISATFSEPMDDLSISTSTFFLHAGDSAIVGTVTIDGLNAVFTPSAVLIAHTVYTATITTGTRDIAENHLKANYSWSFTTGMAADNTPPPKPIMIGVSPGSWTNSPSFSIDWSDPLDASGIAGAYYTLGSGPTSITDGTYTTNHPFTVNTTDEGAQLIYVWLKDGADNADPNNYSCATLFYDATAPTDGNITIIEGDSQLSLSWSGFSDALSGIEQYVLSCSTTGYPSCNDLNAIIYSGLDTNYVHMNLENGTTYYYRICAQDNADNLSHGATAEGTPPPTIEQIPWQCFGHDSRRTGQSPFLGAQTNHLKWSFQTGYEIWSSPAIGSDGTIYVGNLADNNIYALDPNGNLKWTYKTEGWVNSSPAIGSDGTIYVGNDDKNVYALDPNGKLKWTRQTEGTVNSSPAIDSDGTIYVGSLDSNIYALDSNGNPKWTYKTEGPVLSSPAIGSDDTLYVGSNDGYIYALDPNGTLKWSYQTEGWVFSSPAIGSDGTIYVGSRDGYIYALNPNGTLKWSYQTEDWIDSSPAIGSDGTIYVGSYDRNIYALDPNGNSKWTYQTEGWVRSSPAIGSDGTIYVGSYDRNIYALDPNGNSKWTYQTERQIFSSPAIGSDGTVYIGSLDGKLYAFSLKVSSPSIPIGVNATAEESQIVISWDYVNGATSYNIYWSTSPEVTKTNGTKISNVTSPYIHSDLTMSGTYYYVVTAENLYGESSESDEVNSTFIKRANYYVDSINGSNTIGDGTQANPWMTICYALSKTTGPDATIHVAAGIYDTVMDGIWHEVFPINLKDGVSLNGEDKNTTIINANHMAPVFKGKDISNQTTISNFTIKNGKSTNYGYSSENEGNISLSNSDPIIMDNIIEGGQAYFGGAAIKIDGGSPQIINNLIQNNTCGSYGGTIDIEGASSLIIKGNIFFNNKGGMTNGSGGAIVSDGFIYSGSIIISNNIISKTQGHGISILYDGYDISIINNTIVGSSYSGIHLEDGGNGKIINNIIVDSQKYGIEEENWASYDSDPEIAQYNLFYNNIQGHYLDEGQSPYSSVTLMDAYIPECSHNIDGDPIFVDPNNNNYHLNLGSSAIDAGSNDYATGTDIDGDKRPHNNIVDIGADELSLTPPQNIVTFPGDGSVTIIWDEVSEASWYTIYMAEFSDVSKTHYSQKQTVDTTYCQWEVLTNGTTYYFVLISGNSDSESSGSHMVVSIPNDQSKYYIFPDSGINTISKQVTIIGEGFQETPTVALYGGGPYITGSCDTPGYAYAVYVNDTYAYVADGGSGLQVIDTSNPANPHIVGSCDTPGKAPGVYVTGTYAYVADYGSGLQVIDISNPANPHIAGSCDTPGNAYGVYATGTYVYVADYGSGLQVIDISNPANPHIAGSCDTPGNAYSVYVNGTYAYVADGGSGLQVIDISNPANPHITGSCDTPGNAYSVYVNGTYAYVADGGSGLQVIDISNPANPHITGSCDTLGSAKGVYVIGTYAYISDDGGSGLRVVDISNPSNPRIAGSCDTQGSAEGLYVTGTYAYVVDGGSGLQVIDISNPANPSITGTCETPDLAYDVYVAGTYAYVADGESGLQVIDISNPANPCIAGTCETQGSASGIHVAGAYAYVAAKESGLQVIDISNPANPRIAGTCETQGYPMGIYVTGSNAYVANWSLGLQVIDISNPTNPRIVGTCDTPGYAYGVYVAGTYTYVADGESGLQVIDISNPTNPRIAGTCNTPGYAYGVYVAGTYAYVADGGSGLQVIDISNPANPRIAGTCDTPGNTWGVYVTGTYAYTANWSAGLQVIDISNPVNPRIAGTCDTPGYAYGVYVTDTYAYVADSGSGLQVIDKFKPLIDITYINPYIMTAIVSSGHRPGIYNLHITNPDGGHTMLKNAFTVYYLPPDNLNITNLY